MIGPVVLVDLVAGRFVLESQAAGPVRLGLVGLVDPAVPGLVGPVDLARLGLADLGYLGRLGLADLDWVHHSWIWPFLPTPLFHQTLDLSRI